MVSHVGTAAKRYAAALLEVARERGLESRVLADLRAFIQQMEKVPQLKELVTNPTVPAGACAKAVAEIARRMGLANLSEGFLALLASRRRLGRLSEIVEAFVAEQERRAGRERGIVVASGPLTEPQLIRIQSAVSKAVGRQVVLEKQVDPTVLGGLRVSVGDKVFDFTVASYLESLRNYLLANM